MTEGSKAFKRTLASPVWEGVIFPGLERDDPRTSVYVTDIHPSLKPFIEAIWFMTWNIPDGVELSGIGAPIPCIKLMANNFPGFAQPKNTILGVKNTGVLLKFKGTGQAVCVDFKPGGLFPFIGKIRVDPGSVLDAENILTDLPKLVEGPWDTDFASQWSDKIQNYFESRLLNLFPNHLTEISQLMEILLTEREINQVDELLTKASMAKRTLQRAFQNEVGLSLKEVIRIARFNRTIKELNGSSIESFAQFALESGYFDQPHMMNDFKKLVADSPKIFRKYW